jgi:pimeloyl-ACP methyl ester carboxylesterase
MPLPNGEVLAYRACGQGPAVILIHGNMSSSVHWQTTMERLEPSFRVIAPDMRGFGDSTYHHTFDSLAELAADLEALIDGLGISACSLVGWSTGGGVAMEMAAGRPDAVRRIVLVESVPATGYPMFKKDANGAPILAEPMRTKAEIASDPVQVLPALTAMQSGDRETMRAIWNAVIYNLRQPPADDYERYLDAILKQRCLVDLDYALMMFNITHRSNGVADGSGRIDAIRCPVAILQGAHDLVVPEEWSRRTLADFGDRAQWISFPDAGHSPITDDPERFFGVLHGLLNA